MQAKARLNRWDNSFGVVVPKEIIKREHLKEGEEVEIVIRRTSDIKHLFGKYPFKDTRLQKEKMRKGWD